MALPPLDVDYYRYFLGIAIPGYLIANRNYNFWTQWWNIFPHPFRESLTEDNDFLLQNAQEFVETGYNNALDIKPPDLMNLNSMQYFLAVTIVAINAIIHSVSKLFFRAGIIQNFSLIFLNSYYSP